MLKAADLLVGPILRRVEQNLVTVFVALTKPATVDVEVFRGQGAAATLSKIDRRSPTPGIDNHTIAAGKGLHVVAAIWEPAQPSGLGFGEIHSYDLVIKTDSDPAARLADLGLLADNSANPGWLSLGYQSGWLPSFVMVPANVSDLKLVQGSCRGSNGKGRDTMPPLDDFLRTVVSDPAQRPHMLFLTGDQIYADENAPEQLQLLQKLSADFLGGDTPVVETIPVDFKKPDPDPAEVNRYPLDVTHFPPGRRGHLATRIAGFTSDHSDSHSMGYGEFCALYVTQWSNICWREWDASKLLQERKVQFEDYVKVCGQSYQKLATYMAAHPDEDRDMLEKMIAYHAAWRLVPDRYRVIDSTLTEPDREAAWGKADKEDGGRFEAWSRFWVANPEDPTSPDGAPPGGLAAGEDLKKANRLARALSPSWYAGFEYFGVEHKPTKNQLDSLTLALDVTKDKVYDRVRMLEWFRRDLPRVRRLLANIPSYMIFDDHEITDDWNLTPGWAKRTRSSELGRAILRNGLAAATLFQMWGNDPRWYRDGIGRDVLNFIAQMFAGAMPDKPDADQAATDILDQLFDLVPRPPGTSRMTWDYRYDGPGFEVLALDSRTWRGFEPTANPQIRSKFSDDATATLLTDEALHAQIPEQPALGVNPDGVCFVIAGAPVLGFPVVESVLQPIINLVDIASKSRKPAPPFTTLKAAFAVGRVKHDPEPWGFEPSLFENVLARLATRRRVVFFSGDVHYSFTQQMNYWQLDTNWHAVQKTRFIQLTSSSFRQLEAPAPIAVVDLIQQLGGAAAKQARWGWRRGPVGTPAHDPPLERGPNPFGTHLSLLLTQDPIVVSPGSVPKQTNIKRAAEWAWTTEVVGDLRPDEDRLAVLHPPPFSKQSQIDTVRSVGERHFWHAQNAMPRNWHWWTNFTTVEFGKNTLNQNVLRHKIWSYDPLGLEPTLQPFLVAEIPLDVTDDPPEPTP